MRKIPSKGIPREQLIKHLHQTKAQSPGWKAGRGWSLNYYIDEAHQQLLREANGLFFSENYVNPFAQPGLRQMEQEIVEMSAQLFHGDEQSAGCVTSGGTESIFLALYAYRERARKHKPWLKKPELAAPASIHPAFEKAAHMLGVKLRKTGLEPGFRANPAALEKAVNRNTIMIAVSAPSYPHGVIDPVEQIGQLALRKGLPLHIDACIGGYMLPWVEQLGYEVPSWDFRVAGVTSISADIHKFAYGAKGASVLLYRGIDYMRHQFFIAPDWAGGIYASPTLLGTRSGGPVAAAWSAMHTLGQNGYLKLAGELMAASKKMQSALKDIPEITILGSPVMNVFAFSTLKNRPDIYIIAGRLEHKGWIIDRQQQPPAIHITVMKHNLPVIDEYLEDLKTAIAYARNHPQEAGKGTAALYGLMARLPARGMVEKNIRRLFEREYGPNDPSENKKTSVLLSPPDWMGWLNRALRWLGKE